MHKCFEVRLAKFYHASLVYLQLMKVSLAQDDIGPPDEGISWVCAQEW